ncbi:MAG: hypothetical protein MZU95_04970 [Desulfomicrobium escambiense]|nr:hypothetical protein [Desulfomicrobium escambiense]
MASVDDDQMKAFRERYLNAADPEDPLLVRLAQGFLYGNLGSAFILGDKLSTAFDSPGRDLLQQALPERPRRLRPEEQANTGGRRGAVLSGLSLRFRKARPGPRATPSMRSSPRWRTAPPRPRSSTRATKAFVPREVYRDLILGLGIRTPEDFDALLRRYRGEQARVYGMLMDLGGESRGTGSLRPRGHGLGRRSR